MFSNECLKRNPNCPASIVLLLQCHHLGHNTSHGCPLWDMGLSARGGGWKRTKHLNSVEAKCTRQQLPWHWVQGSNSAFSGGSNFAVRAEGSEAAQFPSSCLQASADLYNHMVSSAIHSGGRFDVPVSTEQVIFP